jgi:TRAP transporter 4TM/12TM fusion protein
MMANAFKISDEGWVYVGPPSSTIASILLWGIALEAIRRVGGLPLFFFATFVSLFPLFAEHMPGFLEGTGWSFTGTAMFHAMTRESIVGIPTRVFCNLIVGFMVFGVALQETGGATFFINLSFALFGKVRGGPAKVAVVSSALFGSMSGAAISNVVTTGAMTIPTMKRTGYPAYYAGAVEACASSGGAIMPPVMGAVAFIMASFLMVPYGAVVLAAIIPSLLYFFGLFVQIDGFAARTGLAGLPKSELPSLKETLKSGWIYIFALLTLIYLIFYLKREAQAPFYASLLLLAGAMLRKETRPTLRTVYVIILRSGRLLAEMLAIMAGVGLIIGGLSMTGVAIAFSSELINLVGHNGLLLLLVGALVSFMLGMGMTISACYVFLAIVLIPALTPFGFDQMAVHLFVLYCGLWSFITPPVALAAYAAAGIAGANPMKTGVQSMKLGVVKYFIPFFFVYDPALILHGDLPSILQSAITAFIGVYLVGGSIEGYLQGFGKLNALERVIFLCAGFATFMPGLYTDIGGLALAALTFVVVFLSRRSRTSVTT